MHHFFVDCETLGVADSSIIPMFVAVHIQDEQSIADCLKNHSFICHPSIQDQKDMGRTKDEDTMNWWLKQDKKVFHTVMNQEKAESVGDSAKRFSEYLKNEGLFQKGNTNSDVYIWQRGSKDQAWLSSLYDGKVFLPWWRVRDIRTAVDLAGASKNLDGYADNVSLVPEDEIMLRKMKINGLGEHHPLFDVVRDIVYLRAIQVIALDDIIPF